MNIIRAYRAGDTEKISVQEAQREEYEQAGSGFAKLPYARVLSDEKGHIFAMWGYRLEREGEAQGFALLSAVIGRRLLPLIRQLRGEIPQLMKAENVRRLMITVRADFAQGERMARLLNFYPVRKMPHYFLNYDYQLFERI